MSRVKDVYIKIQNIDVDRYPMNPTTLALIDYLRQPPYWRHHLLPAIKVARKPDGRFEIRDGRHRLLALKLLGFDEIKASFSLKPLRDPHKQACKHLYDIETGKCMKCRDDAPKYGEAWGNYNSVISGK